MFGRNMKKSFYYISLVLFLGSLTFMIGRNFRVSKTPHGSKFSCNTCHNSGGGTPLNSFGLDVNARVTPGGREDFWGPELAVLDSDGDGFTNGEELQDPDGAWTEGSANPGDASLVTHPGNADDFPTSVLFADNIPFRYELLNNYPNPFNPSTTIRFSVAEASHVKIVIYDQVGQQVSELVNGFYAAGTYQKVWNSENSNGTSASGVYFYTMQSGNFVQTNKMLLIK